MNGIEKITNRIDADAQAEIDALLRSAEQEAQQVREGYEQLAETEYRAAVERGQKDAAERIERLGGVAQLEAQKLILGAKQEMLERAFQEAMVQLEALPEDEYVALMAKLAAQSCTTGQESLIFSVKDRERCAQRVVLAANGLLEQAGKPAALTLSEEAREFRGGLYIKNGNVENNCTFETILRLLRQSLSAEVAKLLFD